jgi:hypothetical protein
MMRFQAPGGLARPLRAIRFLFAQRLKVTIARVMIGQRQRAGGGDPASRVRLFAISG